MERSTAVDSCRARPSALSSAGSSMPKRVRRPGSGHQMLRLPSTIVIRTSRRASCPGRSGGRFLPVELEDRERPRRAGLAELDAHLAAYQRSMTVRADDQWDVTLVGLPTTWPTVADA